MTQEEFLRHLKSELQDRGVNKVDEIIIDYREHFTHGLEKGLTEDQIANRLGNPATIAHGYETETLIAKIKSSEDDFDWQTGMRVLWRLLIITPFNFVVLFIPGVIVFSILCAGWAVVGAIGASGLGVFASSFKLGFTVLSIWGSVAFFAASVALMGFCLIGAFIMFWISKGILMMVINYLQWNAKFILEK